MLNPLETRVLAAGTEAGEEAGTMSLSREITRLLLEPEGDDLGRVRPSRTAAARVYEIDTASLPDHPEDVSTDRDGAIRISWRKDGRFLEIVAPYESDAQMYLYYSDGPRFGIADLSALEVWAQWLNGITAS